MPLGKRFYSMGRDRAKDIRLVSEGVSGHHASLVWLSQSCKPDDLRAINDAAAEITVPGARYPKTLKQITGR